MNLLKIKSVVTLLLVGALVSVILFSVFRDRQIPEILLGSFVGGIGLALGYLFAKKDNPIE